MYNLTNEQNIKGNQGTLPYLSPLLWALPLLLFPYFYKREDFPVLIGFFCLSGLGMFLFLKGKNSESKFRIGIVAGILVRVLLLFSPVFLSEDLFRFLWDGAVSLEGLSPFSTLPGEIVFSGAPPWSKELLGKMNSPGYYSVYPLVLQILFLVPTLGMKAFASVPFGIFLWKVIVFVFELFFLLLSNHYKKENFHFLKYWLHPLVLWEGVGNGHPEPILVFFVFASVYLWEKKRPILSLLAYLSGILVKLVPILLLPYLFFLWIRKQKLRFVVLGFLLGFLVFLSGIFYLWKFYPETSLLQKQWKEGIGVYFHLFEYHGGIYYLTKIPMKYTWYPYSAALLLSFFAILGILIFSFVRSGKRKYPDPISEFSAVWIGIFGIYYALSSTIHPWYFLPLVAFSVFSGHIWPLVASFVWILSYSTYEALPYTDKAWVLWVEFVSVFAAYFWERGWIRGIPRIGNSEAD